MVNKNTQNTPYSMHSQPQQLQVALSQVGLPQQQQVPMTTLMIPAAAAAQLQSASAQIQQAALQANLNNPSQPQILVFMIPYMVPNQPPTIPPTPDQGSLNSTLVRQSHLTASMMRASQHQLQTHQLQQLQQQQPLLAQQQFQQPQPQPLLSQQQLQQQQQNTPLLSQQQQQQQQSVISQQQPISNQQQLQQQHQPFLAQQQQHQPFPTPQHQPFPTQQQQTYAGPSQSRTVSSLMNYKQESEKFYIKANFSYNTNRNKGELSFQKGDIMLVIDTPQNSSHVSNTTHYWLATRLKSAGKEGEKGLIPDKSKAEEIALEQRTLNLTEAGCMTDGSPGHGGVLGAGVGRVGFLKRRAAQRSKSLCRDNWDNVVFDIGNFKLPSYERVVFKHPGFCRPVVIFGPLADVAREKLLKDYPEKYSYPTGFNNQPHGQPKVIRLKGILEVIDQGKHALLDVTPSAVEKLNYVNLAPIVIFMKTDSKSMIKEFRSRAAKSLVTDAKDEENWRRDGKSSRKLLEQSIKLEKIWYHVFTATLNLSTMGSEMWYRKLRETIENQQSANVWMSDRKSDKKIAMLAGNTNVNTNSTSNTNTTSNTNNQASSSSITTNNSDVLFTVPPQSSTSCIDNTTFMNERFSESLNITSKSTIDLLPDGTYRYNRDHSRNAHAHSMAQKMARASSEPKLNGIMGPIMHDDDNDDDEDDNDDDEIIKKPFPAEYENSSSVSSSNGAGPNSYGQANASGVSSAAQLTYQHYVPQIPKPDNQIFSTNSSLNPTMTSNNGNNNNNNNNSLSRATQESIYSRNPIINNNSSSYSNGNSSSMSNYHPLPPMTAENGYQLHHNSHHSMNNINSNNNVIDLSRNHETRGSAFQVYSDMNQNNYHYYNLNKIL